jgi:acyl carrier protein
MSYNSTYSEIKKILSDSQRISKVTMLKVAKLAIIETLGETQELEAEVTWDSKLADDLMLDSLAMVELVMFLEECFNIEIPDEEAGNIVTVGDAIEVIKKCKANKGKKKTVNAAKYKSKQTEVPHPESPFMTKQPLSNLPSNDKIAQALDEALEEEE